MYIPGDVVPAAQCYLYTCQDACAQGLGLQGPAHTSIVAVAYVHIFMHAHMNTRRLAKVIVTRVLHMFLYITHTPVFVQLHSHQDQVLVGFLSFARLRMLCNDAVNACGALLQPACRRQTSVGGGASVGSSTAPKKALRSPNELSAVVERPRRAPVPAFHSSDPLA